MCDYIHYLLLPSRKKAGKKIKYLLSIIQILVNIIYMTRVVIQGRSIFSIFLRFSESSSTERSVAGVDLRRRTFLELKLACSAFRRSISATI